ncbi:LysR family transcriptional regulator [Pendulispora rubella]|uniref:LysR family transcriptional regulator n=1 Tax=Pendulispora rubella TaxID=2741070 RepID=A0ABZ2L9B5_9BACT
MPSIPRIQSLEVFVHVAEQQSFVRAAKRLGITPSSVTRTVAKLEDELGVQLLRRTTRRVSLTEAGALYHDRCARILAELAEADSLVTTARTRPRGVVRMQVPASFGRMYIGPLLPKLLAEQPDLQIDVGLSDTYADLIEERVDVAVRIGKLADSRLVSVRLAPNRRVLCASPDCVERYGPLHEPRDLSRYPLLSFSPMVTGDAWRLRSATGDERTVPVLPRLRANNAEVLREAMLAGTGIAMLATFLIGDDLRRGRAVHVLPGWMPLPTSIYAVYPASRHVPSKVQVVVDFLRRQFRGPPPWER